MSRAQKLAKLLVSTLYISSFTFGGGFVIVTFMKRKFVDELHWLTEQEMLDITALAQASPGSIAVNAAILVGWKMDGLLGMMVAVFGTILPPMVILSIISFFYNIFYHQSLCCRHIERLASRSGRRDPGCCLRFGRQCAVYALPGVSPADGCRLCRQLSF